MPHIKILLVAAMLPLMVSCKKPAEQMPEFPPQQAVWDNPIQADVTGYVLQTGVTEASKRVDIRTRVAGYLTEIHFNDGDLVRADQELIVIDEEPFQVKVNVAKAKLDEANANLLKAQQSQVREIAQAKVELVEANLNLVQTNYARNLDLQRSNAASKLSVDESEAEVKKNTAEISSAKAELQQALSDYDINLAAAQAAVALADSEYKSANIDLGYCRIKSPIDGRIARRMVDPGNYVIADGSSVLTTIVSVSPLYAYLSINENDLLKIRQAYPATDPGAKIPIEMGIAENGDFPYQGELDYIAPTVQTGTGTVQVRGLFNNDKMHLLPGMFIRARIPAEKFENAILISERSIGYDQAGSFVYVIAKGKADPTDPNSPETDVIARRDVTLGVQQNGRRVVLKNLTKEDKVIQDGLHKFRVGAPVSPIFILDKQKADAEAMNPAAHGAQTAPASENTVAPATEQGAAPSTTDDSAAKTAE